MVSRMLGRKLTYKHDHLGIKTETSKGLLPSMATARWDWATGMFAPHI